MTGFTVRCVFPSVMSFNLLRNCSNGRTNSHVEPPAHPDCMEVDVDRHNYLSPHRLYQIFVIVRPFVASEVQLYVQL